MKALLYHSNDVQVQRCFSRVQWNLPVGKPTENRLYPTLSCLTHSAHVI